MCAACPARARLGPGDPRLPRRGGFIEVETPVLQPISAAARRGRSARTTTRWSARSTCASPGAVPQALVIGGLERVFELGRDFRNEGCPYQARPRVHDVESYEAYADHDDVMARTKTSSPAAAEARARRDPVDLREHRSTSRRPGRGVPLPRSIGEPQRHGPRRRPPTPRRCATARARPAWRPRTPPGRRQAHRRATDVFVEPHLIQPTFLVDYPVELSPLAKPKRDDPTTVERFEAFVCGMEAANASRELNDPRTSGALRGAGPRRGGRRRRGQPVDDDFLEALDYGMPPDGRRWASASTVSRSPCWVSARSGTSSSSRPSAGVGRSLSRRPGGPAQAPAWSARPASRRGRRTVAASPTAPSRRTCAPGASGSARTARRPARRPAPPLDGGLDGPAPLAGVLTRSRCSSASVGSSASACAVRSSSHEPTTLPRRQSSAMSATSRS